MWSCLSVTSTTLYVNTVEKKPLPRINSLPLSTGCSEQCLCLQQPRQSSQYLIFCTISVTLPSSTDPTNITPSTIFANLRNNLAGKMTTFLDHPEDHCQFILIITNSYAQQNSWSTFFANLQKTA